MGPSELRGREVRLRQEYARLYPFLTPGVWQSAAVVTEKVVSWRLEQPAARALSWERVLNPEHFEFRGASPPPEHKPPGQTAG